MPTVMGLRVIDGRWITDRDRADSPPVVVISESFAKQHFAGERAIGQRLQYYSGRPTGPPAPAPEIVGVVSDVRQFGMAEREAPQMYVPHAQRAWTFTSFFVRTAGDPRSVMASLPAAVHAIDPDRPLERVRTLDELISNSTADRRALSGLLLMAAAIALLISTIGVYGVTAATTAARRRELAIRAAIGADRGAAHRAGRAPGPRRRRHRRRRRRIGGAIAASSVLESVLFEVKARDPWTFATVGLGAARGLRRCDVSPGKTGSFGQPRDDAQRTERDTLLAVTFIDC